MRLGETAMLSCRAIAGIPLPTIVWSRRDHSPFSHLVKEEHPGTIVIHNITSAEAGMYECRGSNIAGDVSQAASIIVHAAPTARIVPNEEELRLTEGDELKIECLADGDPAPNVEWKEPTAIMQAGVFGSPPPSSNYQPHAVIHRYNIRRSDEGTYICRATNDAGVDEKYITILVDPKRGDAGKCLS